MQFDYSRAFLQGPLRQEVYITIPKLMEVNHEMHFENYVKQRVDKMIHSVNSTSCIPTTK